MVKAYYCCWGIQLQLQYITSNKKPSCC